MSERLLYVVLAVVFGQIIDAFSLEKALIFLGGAVLIIGLYAVFQLSRATSASE